jgi:hypothetical protein
VKFVIPLNKTREIAQAHARIYFLVNHRSSVK